MLHYPLQRSVYVSAWLRGVLALYSQNTAQSFDQLLELVAVRAVSVQFAQRSVAFKEFSYLSQLVLDSGDRLRLDAFEALYQVIDILPKEFGMDHLMAEYLPFGEGKDAAAYYYRFKIGD